MKMAVMSLLVFVSFLFTSKISCEPCICNPSSNDQTKDCECKPVQSKSYYLGLTDEDLYEQGLQGIGQCYIQSGGGYCDLYVKSGIIGQAGQTYKGYPLSTQCRGTGCVKTPDFPRGINTCWYSDPEYGSNVNSRTGRYCTNNGIANAAAQLRDAIMYDACDCQAKSATVQLPSSPPSPRQSPPRQSPPCLSYRGGALQRFFKCELIEEVSLFQQFP